MQETLTVVFEKSPYGYIGYVEKLPGANTQGATLEEAKSNLIEAIQLVLEANRRLAEEEEAGKEVIKEALGTILKVLTVGDSRILAAAGASIFIPAIFLLLKFAQKSPSVASVAV